jgi:hypothetical protein
MLKLVIMIKMVLDQMSSEHKPECLLSWVNVTKLFEAQFTIQHNKLGC